ncbi:heparan-alpha-glucosaminide N-acetyltransferase domain-containing protein [Dyella sp. OK004]|uniref:DUF1624 domain-containing protein n=1 Tax=Dyella sp. OK004 TaxID=1855292 RepID=UPI000B80909F|nr:heparan-alpha-glucosaminide N-acetyltransferase domain-containing protein [Dyella sp. OK004]
MNDESALQQTATLTAAGADAEAARRRIRVVDLLRGLVLALMVLDHTRDFFHVQAFEFSPTDPEKTTLMLFATRWVTHLCAPTFVFLAGTSIYLQRENGKSRSELARFLLSRGLWLIALELTVISFAFNFALPFAFMQVIWAIGGSMMLMAALIYLPARAVLLIGMVIVAGHNALASVDAASFGPFAPVWALLMQLGEPPFGPGLVAYPLIPWFGIMCLGYGCGHVFVQTDATRRRTLALLAAACLLVFLVLRLLNGYGDQAPWSQQTDSVHTFISFINVSKYPPSLLYVLATLGVSLGLSLGLERLRGWPERALLAYGRTPLFTYLLHIYLIHGLAVLVGLAQGVPPSDFINFLGDTSRLAKAHWGVSLPMVYLIWVAILVALYPCARWYAALKVRRRHPLLSYL